MSLGPHPEAAVSGSRSIMDAPRPSVGLHHSRLWRMTLRRPPRRAMTVARAPGGAHGMANEEQLAILRQGPEAWNAWRQEHPDSKPDLIGANLGLADLSWATSSGPASAGPTCAGPTSSGPTSSGPTSAQADLGGADLGGANLGGAYLQRGRPRRGHFARNGLSRSRPEQLQGSR